ncbi:AfsA-related hotdog domain-containing protein [Streptomyces sp. AM 2-1-1]|uniref:AfsA-related hotdog domain-containing protein n=1 Tax=Streptomyces sp. AM 2-1-1 TaxID=3028709 RepID=UPI0023BA31BA|nr:AfsA-related hotdog domain-containing protein [Streptomyces sp. AM 2-1-1]WEH43452.1 AfsA-related hotdog domain-containing protein [Streptomyces sp. AM 2-1-1]
MPSTCTCIEGSGGRLATFPGAIAKHTPAYVSCRRGLRGAVGHRRRSVQRVGHVCPGRGHDESRRTGRTRPPGETTGRRTPRDGNAERENRFLVSGIWPADHGFFARRTACTTPLLLVKSMRQSTVLIGHGAYGVQLDHHFLMGSLDFTCDPAHLRAAGSRRG